MCIRDRYKSFRNKRIKVNGKRGEADTRLSSGDVIELYICLLYTSLTPEERSKNQEDFVYDRKRVMVATNAFGMGIDKSNVSFVLHYKMCIRDRPGGHPPEAQR